MDPTLAISLLWLGFAASHMLLSSVRLRPRLVAALGQGPFLGLYSLVALAIFVPLVGYYFDHKHAGPWLWVVPRSELLTGALYLGNGVAFSILVAGVLNPSPGGFIPASWQPRGVLRITRHPVFMGLALWAAMHLVVNGAASDVAFFGGALLFSLVGCYHQDRRKLATEAEHFAPFYAATPFLPFTGAGTWRGLRELSLLVVGLGIGLTVALRFFHSAFFGP